MKKFNGKHLTDIRKRLGLSLREVSVLLGQHDAPVQSQSVLNWEIGRCVPKHKHLVGLSTVFNVKLEYFFDTVEKQKEA